MTDHYLFTDKQIDELLDIKEKILNQFNEKINELEMEFTYDVFISGGIFTSMMNGKEVKDIDIYFKSADDAKEVVDKLTKERYNDIAEVDPAYRDVQGTDGKWITDRAVTMVNGLQFIHGFTGEPLAVTNTFDYVHCTPYLDVYDGRLYMNKIQYECCKNELLLINNFQHTTEERKKKFKKRGFSYWSSKDADVFSVGSNTLIKISTNNWETAPAIDRDKIDYLDELPWLNVR